MKCISRSDVKSLFSNLCCSQCRNDFSIDSIEILEQQNDILICKLICPKCGKDFGDVVLNYSRKSKYHSALEVVEGQPPISTDDVIDAHEFIKKNL